jgi:hypothetical protein
VANRLAITLHALAQRSSDSQGDSTDIGEVRSAAWFVATVTEVTGGRVRLTIQTSPDDSAWRDVRSTPDIHQPGKVKLWLDDLDRYVRLKWDVSTTATFRVAGEAHTAYCGDDGLFAALPDDVYEQSEEWIRIKARIDASSIVETVAGSRHDLPLTVWEAALSKRAEQIAARYVQDKHVLNGGGEDANVTRGHDEAMAWIERIRTNEIVQPNTTPAADNAVQTSSGNPDDPDEYRPLFDHDWGDYG